MTRRLPLLLAFALGLAACSTTDSRSDEERIAGVRPAETINARLLGGISVPVQTLEETEPASQVSFGAGSAFAMRLVLPDSLGIDSNGIDVTIPLPDQVSLTGTYRLDTETQRVILTRAGISQTVTLRYAFRGSDGLELIAEGEEAITALLGLAGPDAQRLAGVVQGMSVRFGDPLSSEG